MQSILVTGGTGFIGSHLVEHLLNTTTWNVTILDRLDLTSTIDRLEAIDHWDIVKRRVNFVWWDLRSPINEYTKKKLGSPMSIIHLAASTHVDRSIDDPLSFVMDNVVGTTNLLDYARSLLKLQKVIVISTDEVMGSAGPGVNYVETDHVRPENPYAGTKVGVEGMAFGYACTYKLPVLIARPMNVFGSRQHKEKFIPSTIKKISAGEEVIIHADSTKKISGSRFYISAGNVATALTFLLSHCDAITKEDRDSGVYNIVGEKEVSNLELAGKIAKILDKPLLYTMVDFHSSRPGHDLRYSLDGSRLRSLGWEVSPNFEESLKNTVRWYIENPDWLGL